MISNLIGTSLYLERPHTEFHLSLGDRNLIPNLERHQEKADNIDVKSVIFKRKHIDYEILICYIFAEILWKTVVCYICYYN